MFSEVFDKDLPRKIGETLGEIFGEALSKQGDDDTYRIAAFGRFQGPMTTDLLNFARRRGIDGALLITEQEHHRELFFHDGHIVGSASSALFEQFGRLLLSAELIDKEDANTLAEMERDKDASAVMRWLPDDMASWVVYRRAWEVVVAMYFVGHGHFLFVEGAPQLDMLPEISIAPLVMATQGQKLYDAWRREPSVSTDLNDCVPGGPPLPPAAEKPLTREPPAQLFGDFIDLLQD